MDLHFTPEQERFRKQLRAWLEQNLPPGWGTPAYREPDSAEEHAAFGRAWQRKLHEGGWAGLTWPKEYGGRDASVIEAMIWSEEYARVQGPDIINLGVGIGLVGPTLMTHGSAWQKERLLPRILRGDDVWCQGFSEPDAGSDLAAVRTRGEVRGDEIIVTGQKTWTSFAHYADWCILVVRTDPEAPKHAGLSFLVVDMKTPGITIRPLMEMTGESWFNQVFFDQVRVPRENLVGELGQGWNVVITTLAHERGTGAMYAYFERRLHDLIQLARSLSRNGAPWTDDPELRQRLAQYAIEMKALRYSALRNVTALERNRVPGPVSSIFKLFWSELDQRMKQTAGELLGPYLLLPKGEPRAVDHGRWHYELLWSRAASIYAGTSEIQRNIIADRVLGLPR
ncbi:MAG: acyl-CoA dehydrogenase [Deltaproteobacteria bacterium]|nr:acyl-CoA dehydrogenase [Deltaproteobacteria bacterium]MCZ6821956.1 acyl-CoA dehydrogenase [Deltaproteobacteria bacterium]